MKEKEYWKWKGFNTIKLRYWAQNNEILRCVAGKK